MRTLLSAFLVGMLVAMPVHAASSFVWSDADYGFHLAFPDTWKQQGGLPADGRIRLLAPGGEGAHCTVFARKDARFTLYPREFLAEVVAQEFQWEYWEQIVAAYEDLYYYYDNYGGLGGGDARYTLIDFIDYGSATAGQNGVRKRARIFATIYGDTHMMAACIAPLESFARYNAGFANIIDSIRMDARYTPDRRGYYRDFLETREYNHHWHEPFVTLFYPRKTMSAYTNCSRAEDLSACLSKPKPLPIRTR